MIVCFRTNNVSKLSKVGKQASAICRCIPPMDCRMGTIYSSTNIVLLALQVLKLSQQHYFSVHHLRNHLVLKNILRENLISLTTETENFSQIDIYCMLHLTHNLEHGFDPTTMTKTSILTNVKHANINRHPAHS